MILTFDALLLDDAAIFPPGNVPLAEAISAHHAHRAAPYARLVGPLVVALADLPGLTDTGQTDAPLDVAVVVPDAAGAVAAIAQIGALEGVRLVALEVTDADVADLRDAIGEPAGVTVYVELPRDERRASVIAALAGTSYRAKLRTGGTQAEAYPDEAELAAAVVALARAGVRFKATAGLHHALRNTDPETGFEQHGFLNLLAATDTALGGADVDAVAAVLAERDAHRVLLPGNAVLLGSVGTCSIDEPVAELTDLGLLDLAGVR